MKKRKERVGTGPFQKRMLLAAGLCFAADSMEVLLLSFLAVVVQAEWDLSSHQTSGITASVFLGAMSGTLLLGPLGDKFGRVRIFDYFFLAYTAHGSISRWTPNGGSHESFLVVYLMILSPYGIIGVGNSRGRLIRVRLGVNSRCGLDLAGWDILFIGGILCFR